MTKHESPPGGRPYGREFVEEVGPSFARHLRARRVAMGMSQQHVVLFLEVEHGIVWHQTVVAKIEAGQRQVKLTEAYALADVLNLPLEQLIRGDVAYSRR